MNLYRETIALLRPAIQTNHLEVAEQAIQVIDKTLALQSSMFSSTKQEQEYGTVME